MNLDKSFEENTDVNQKSIMEWKKSKDRDDMARHEQSHSRLSSKVSF